MNIYKNNFEKILLKTSLCNYYNIYFHLNNYQVHIVKNKYNIYNPNKSIYNVTVSRKLENKDMDNYVKMLMNFRDNYYIDFLLKSIYLCLICTL